MKTFSFIDLFSGAGGFTEGFLLASNGEAGFSLLAASDIHENAMRTHTHRFQTQIGLSYSFIKEDIRSPQLVSLLRQAIEQNSGTKSVDVVIGGPPCQGFSVFGPRDESDPRNDLFHPYLNVIESLAPQYFVMENVPGLESMYGGSTVERIYEEVSLMGPPRYSITGPVKINAADYGVPQLRERILFLGSREDVSPLSSIAVNRKGRLVTVKEAIGDLSFLNTWESNGSYNSEYPPASKYQTESRKGRLFKKLGIKRNDDFLHNHEAAKHSPKVIARFAMIEPGEGTASIPSDLWKRHLHTSKKWCVRLHPEKPSYTVVTLPDDLIHYSRHRILTVREMARIQSFDDTFVFLGPRSTGGGGKGNMKRKTELPQYSQVGNAVPPLMAKAIAETILKSLQRTV